MGVQPSKIAIFENNLYTCNRPLSKENRHFSIFSDSATSISAFLTRTYNRTDIC